jgi:exonuclease SbcC
MNGLKDRIVLLEQAEATCPLCRQSLTNEDRHLLLDQFQMDGEQMGASYRDNLAATDELERQSGALEQQISECGPLLKEMGSVHRQDAALAERIERGRQAAAELDSVRANLAAAEQRLAEADYAPEAQARLEQTLGEAAELGYDVSAHQAAREAVREGQAFADRKARLENAQEVIVAERAALVRLENAEQHWRDQCETERSRQAELVQEAAELRSRLEGAEAVEERLHRVRGAEAAARQRLGAGAQRLEACKALERQRADKRKRRRELAADRRIYNELRMAFGVRGVPAMVIEAAVPEIEAEANRILARMTRGQMHVRFDTQRETLAGEVREALEIRISDGLGTRPYENYSGGEQFRVNFAIRVGLSRLLARRAGAQLETLVIDEGFGTQDALGRDALVEAINAIKNDFGRVLVITHIDELKDAFPARIEVTRTPDGSTVRLA